jgi:hypothetical protein
MPAEDFYLLGQQIVAREKSTRPCEGALIASARAAHTIRLPQRYCRPSLHYGRKQSRARTHANEQKIVVQFSNPSIPSSTLVCLLVVVANIDLLSPSACQLLQSYLIDLAANLALHLFDLFFSVDRIRLGKVED